MISSLSAATCGRMSPPILAESPRQGSSMSISCVLMTKFYGSDVALGEETMSIGA